MIRINLKQPVKRGAIIVAIATKKPSLLSNRLASISHMSGYPTALHVIGRLQRMLDTSSYSNLLISIRKLRDICKITAEVIDSMEGVKTDRFQLNRTEIISYITDVTSSLKTTAPSTEEIDLIAHLITAFEANNQAWLLQGGIADESNLHLAFSKLYKEVLRGDGDVKLATYNPHTDEISTLGDLPHMKLTEKEKKTGGNPDRLRDALTLYQYSSVRIIDHIYSLLMDKDVWYNFVTPRTKSETSTNIERGKSLKIFALYLQNLLSYNQFFMLESFLYSYDLVQKWVTHFPPLEASTQFRLDNVIRPHDLLGAKKDVEDLFNSFGHPSDDIYKNTIVFPAEFIATMGLKKSVNKLMEESVKFSMIDPMSDIGQLDKPLYLPLISGVAIGDFDVAYDLTSILLNGKRVSAEIDTALGSLTPSLVRGSSAATIDGLKTLGLRAPQSFKVPHAYTWHIMSGVNKEISGGKLYLDSGAPRFSWQYHDFIRNKASFSMLTDDQIMNKFGGIDTKMVFDRDKSKTLRDIMSYDWRSLYPAAWNTGTKAYTKESLASNHEEVRVILETLTGRNFDIITRELQVAHLRKIWATYFSSFGLIYIDENAINLKENTSGAAVKMPLLVEGYGRPYGLGYVALASKQPKLTKPEDFIRLANGVYLQMLEKIPVVSDELHFEPSFYQEHPMMIFKASDKDISVTHWVIDDGLLHMTMFPVDEISFIPPVQFTSRYAYLTKGLYMNIELYYKPSVPESAREITDLGITKSEWPYERHRYFLEYKNFGPYAAKTLPSVITQDEELVRNAVEKIEKQMTDDTKEEAQTAESAGTASKEASKRIAAAVETVKTPLAAENDSTVEIVKK